MKSIKELLNDKRQGATWAPVDVERFVHGVVHGEVSAAQAGAFLMAACIHDLADTETAALTTAMAHSGARFERGLAGRPAVDKHSTGGVGDKVSLLLAPLAAACGLAVPMISGRGLGHTGGTVDKLESIRGLRMDLSMTELSALLQAEGLFMAAQTPDLAPADRILYALRDVTGTVENVGLITASILSKKFAEGLDGLVMDLKVGSGAFMKDRAAAERLATSIKRTCDVAGLSCTIVFTRMDRPLGAAVGNWVEVVEAEVALQDPAYAHPDLHLVTSTLVEEMLLLGGICATEEEAADRVHQAWSSREAWKLFHRMLERQGGSWSASVQQYASTPQAVVEAAASGTVVAIDPMAVAQAVLHAGGGRRVETDRIDPVAGVVFQVDVGDEVTRGQPLATIHAEQASVLPDLAVGIQAAVHMATAPAEQEPSVILDVWR